MMRIRHSTPYAKHSVSADYLNPIVIRKIGRLILEDEWTYC